jgi:protein-tyrosine phosphatase
MKRLNIKLEDDLHAFAKSRAAVKKVTLQQMVVNWLLNEQRKFSKKP